MKIITLFDWLPRWARRHMVVKLCIRLFPGLRKQAIEFNEKGKAFVDLADPNPRNYFLTKSFEPEFFEIALPFLNGGGTFFDCGANFGLCSFGLAGMVQPPNVDFHLFEANPGLVPFLNESRGLHPMCRFTITHGCLSDRVGTSRLSISEVSSGQSFATADEGVNVDNVVLDDYIEHRAISEVTFMKLDIEGYEPYALRGLVRSFQNGIVKAIYVEASPETLARAGFAMNDLVGLLREGGFAVFLCKPEDIARVPTAEWFSCRICDLPLRLAPLNVEIDFQTDFLAIHKTSGFFTMIQPSLPGQA